MVYFLDTNALLIYQECAFETKFYISNITLHELENIKTSGTKDEEIKYKARRVLRLLDENPNNYGVIIYKNSFELKELPPSADSQIIACALHLKEKIADEVIFVTNDLSCKALAQSLFLKTKSLESQEEDYTGYKEQEMNDDNLAYFYNNYLAKNENVFNLLDNEYLLIKQKGHIIDKYKWHDNHYIHIPFYKIESKMFGKILPKDEYQHIAMDSLMTNQITVLRGKAGSGKSYLGLSYLINQLEQGKINKLIIFCNTVAVRGSAKLGFYPGDKNEKLLDSQIGNFLASKFGDITEVEKMIDQGFLLLLPVADCRGFDTTGMNAGIYMTESQNTSTDMMKLILQRIGEDSICVIEGDDITQVDMREYSGFNNGLKRLSKIFRGHDFYGEVTLPIVHRGKIASLADKM